MEKQNKSVIEAISEAIANATGNENFTLPLDSWKKIVPPSDEINAAYVEEVEKYKSNPVAPCNKDTALKLLKRFSRKSFRDFWTAPVEEYLPAVSEGTMKLCETVYPHDEAIIYARKLIAALSP